MLFEQFPLTIHYRNQACELEIREVYSLSNLRTFEVIQGGIGIMLLMVDNGVWSMCIVDDLHEVVKQDTDNFVNTELVDVLIQAIVNYFDCFTGRPIKRI